MLDLLLAMLLPTHLRQPLATSTTRLIDIGAEGVGDEGVGLGILYYEWLNSCSDLEESLNTLGRRVGAWKTCAFCVCLLFVVLFSY